MNLKQVLMLLGNELVGKGYTPASMVAGSDPSSTKPIKDFTEWINSNPDVIASLEGMGIEWPVVEREQRKGESFMIVIDGAEESFDITGVVGNLLRGVSRTESRDISMMIGEQHVKKEDRERFKRCVKDLGGVVDV